MRTLEEKLLIRREFRFYTCVIIGSALIFLGCLLPPMGEIHNSIIVTAGMFLSLGGLAVGIDLKGCIHELVELKKIKREE